MTYSIKFQFEIDLINNDALDNIFKKIGSLLNIQLDENLKPYTHNIKPDYDIIDISKLNQEHIESKINSFFSFDFLKTVDVSVIFQYVPDWIAYDGIKEDEKNEFLSSEISDNVIDNLLGDKDDLIAKFIVQIFQTDENYNMLIVNSNNYSEKMITDFVDTFNLILSEIIHKEPFSNISSVFK